jgi:O-antigen ligase
MPGGIPLGLYFGSCVIAGAGLSRACSGRTARIYAGCSLYLLVILLMCRSYAAIFYTVVLAWATATLGWRRQRILALVLVVIMVTYPASRFTEIFPTRQLVSAFSALSEIPGLSEIRPGSLQFRFDNEDELLQHAMERPLFGWGGFNRNQIYDPLRGLTTSTTDGGWIIQIGKAGLVGWAIFYALLLIPVIRSRRALDRASRADKHLVSALVLIVMMYTVDQLPNGFYTSLPFFYAGALVRLGRVLGWMQRAPPPSTQTPTQHARNRASAGPERARPSAAAPSSGSLGDNLLGLKGNARRPAHR